MSSDRAVIILLPGKKDMDDHYQLLREEVALSKGAPAGSPGRGDLRSRFQAGEWTEAAGRTAFGDWYRVFKSRSLAVPVVAAQSDELAVGVRGAIRELDDPRRREDLSRAKLLGMDGCPAYGRRLVDEGTLTATIENAANTSLAIELLHRFWTENGKLPLRSFTELRPDPASSIPTGNPAD